MAIVPSRIRERIVIYKIKPKPPSTDDEIRKGAQTRGKVAFLSGVSKDDVISLLTTGESYPTDCHKTGFLGGIQNFFSDQECYYNDGSDPSFVGVLLYGRVIYEVYYDAKGWYVNVETDEITKKYIRGSLFDWEYSDYVADSVTFDINPKHISIERKKMKRKIRTYGGWEFQHWGPDIGTVSIKGQTRAMIPRKTVREGKDDWGVYDSASYKAFEGLKNFYDNDHRVEAETKVDKGELLALSYREKIYVGHFDSFTFEEDAEKPYLFHFDIRFSIEFEATNLAEAIETSGKRKIYNETFMKDLRGVTS